MDFFSKHWLVSQWRLLLCKLDALFDIYEADESVAAGFRAQQVRAILVLTPLTMLANLINAAIILFNFFNTPIFPALVVWAVVLGYFICRGTRAWLLERNKPPSVQASPRALVRAIRHAALLGGMWGLLPILAFNTQDPHLVLLIITICTGMLCAGGFALATIPQAAVTYVLLLAFGYLVALIKDGLFLRIDLVILLTIYAFIVCAAVMATAKTFGARLMAEAETAHQQQLVSLLLHDFESHTSDWLWEIDKQGFLINPSKKILHTSGRSTAELCAAPFVDLFDPTFEIASDSNFNIHTIIHLSILLNGFTPFREIILPIIVNGDRRWWQLTAKPLFNNANGLIGWRGVGSDITHKRTAEEEISKLINVDALTGLANRHQFNQQLEKIRVQNTVEPFSLFILDLDNFKHINESLGHDFGDRILKMIAQRLQKTIRVNDFLARLGGDEFAVLSYGDNSNISASLLAQRLLEAFNSPCNLGDLNLPVSCSIGIAIAMSAEHGIEPGVLLKNADMALYAAKAAGRNTFRFHEAGMEIRARKKLHLLNDMRSALEEHSATQQLLNKKFSSDLVWPLTPITGQFEIYFQPQIKLATKEIIGFEALLRWHHPQQGLISPVHFIPLAEESNLIIPIGVWVLVEACKYAAKWDNDWRIAVNLSAVQFREGNVVDIVRWALRISQLKPERLELEITESLLIHDNVAAKQALIELRELGVRVALDDFGTGYSSLAYLRSFPLNTLKIDRSFVSALTQDASALAIVTAIIQLADALHLDTTAEGIESQMEADILRNCGCTDAQGFFFGRPERLSIAIADANAFALLHNPPRRDNL